LLRLAMKRTFCTAYRLMMAANTIAAGYITYRGIELIIVLITSRPVLLFYRRSGDKLFGK